MFRMGQEEKDAVARVIDSKQLFKVNNGPLQEVANFVATRLSTIEGVTQTRSHFMLKPYKKDGIIMDDKEKDRRLVMTP